MSDKEIAVHASLVTGSALSDASLSTNAASYRLTLCLANSSESRFLIRNRLFTPRMGDVMLSAPYDLQHFIARGEGFEALRLAFPPSVAEEMLFHTTGRLTAGKHVFRLRSAAKYLSLSKESLSSLDAEALLSLLRETEESGADAEAYLAEVPLPLLLQKSLSYLNCHYNEPVSGVFLANRYEVSAKTIDNLFRDYVGLRVGEIAERLRLLKALELMDCGIETEAILSTVGVRDADALSALLKKFQ